jgi:hypothetical protein
LRGKRGTSKRIVCGVALFAYLLAAPAAAQAPPANDNFASAAILSGTEATAVGTNVDATEEPGEPNHAGDAGGFSVWWRWTAPATGAVTIDTCDSDFDTVLAVYTGAAVNALTPVRSSDDACDIASSVTFVATEAQVYSIAVDGLDEETGEIRLRLQRTLRLDARTLARPGRIDATRFTIDVASNDEDFGAPQLVLVRAATRIAVDLDLDNELDSETRFRFTFQWECQRRGAWRWTAAVTRGGIRATEEGTFTVPRCVRRSWFVSRSQVARDFRGDFPTLFAHELRCSPVGPTRGSLAHTWRCGIVKAGATCSGSFTFRYSRVFQGSDVVARIRAPSGSVTCRR